MSTVGELPVHVGFILDGNRRWAKGRGLDSLDGHAAGFETVKRIVPFVFEQGIKVVSLYVLSEDNFTKRPYDEVYFLIYTLLSEAIDKDLPKFIDRGTGTRIRFIGDKSILPRDIRQKIDDIEQNSRTNTQNTLVIALAYSGRNEIKRAVQRMSRSGFYIDIEELTVDDISRHLDAPDVPNPDLIIRTAEQRLSDFLPWQSVYSELYMLPEKYWPDFTEQDFLDALEFYKTRVRKFGGNA